jgi:hypothetical protein
MLRLKNLVRRTINHSIRQVRRFLSESAETSCGNGDFAYHDLNTILMQLHENDKGDLRPNYTWGVLQGAHLAKALNLRQISVIEFGVAGGNGLLALESAAAKVETVFNIKIDVYGFDTGSGLPKPKDYRDLPNLWQGNAFPMDVEELSTRLNGTHLVLGDVGKTIEEFIRSKPAPIGFVSFDLDYHSSTMHALRIFEANSEMLLPRVPCYFDDIMGFTYAEYNGERLAISDFNSSHETRKVSPIFGLKYYLPSQFAQMQWSEQFFMAHFFDHPLYERPDGLVKRFVGSGTDLKENAIIWSTGTLPSAAATVEELLRPVAL